MTTCYSIIFTFFSDPASTFCNSALHPPEGTVDKPHCEINPFTPQASMVKWAAPLTASAQSPVYLNADWISVAAQGLNGELTLSSVMRAPSGSKEPSGNYITYITSHYIKKTSSSLFITFIFNAKCLHSFLFSQ